MSAPVFGKKMGAHGTTSGNHAQLPIARVLGLAVACSVILAVSACSGNDTTPDPAPEQISENNTTTTTSTTPAEEPQNEEPQNEEPEPQEESQREDPRSDSEASELINWILDQPTTYSIRGEATISTPSRLIEQSLLPTDSTPEHPFTQNAETLITQAVFESDTEGDLSILAHTPPGLHYYLPEGGSYQIIYEDDTMFFRSPFIEHTRTEEEVWLAFTTTDEHQTLLNGLSCIFFIPEPEEEDTGEGVLPTRCNLQDGLHAVLSNAYDIQTAGTETVYGLPTTKVSFNISSLSETQQETLREQSLLQETSEEIGGTPDHAAEPGTSDTEESSDVLINDYLASLLGAPLNGTVWIDGNNLIRRMDINSTTTPSTSGSPDENKQAMTLWFHSFGADISVEAPTIEHVEGEHIISLTASIQQKGT